jgi:hypothetical protein
VGRVNDRVQPLITFEGQGLALILVRCYDVAVRLIDLYPTLSQEQRKTLATKAGIKPPFLWQIATHWDGRRPSLRTIERLAKAHPKLKLADLVAEFTE